MRARKGFWIAAGLTVLLSLLALLWPATSDPPPVRLAPPSPLGPLIDSGPASVYSDQLEGRPTSSGEPYRADQTTCAHRTLPFGTEVQIVSKRSGAWTTCRVNDRGPYAEGRIVDLSKKAARRLGIFEPTVFEIELRKVDW